jgi:hypothetical protein
MFPVNFSHQLIGPLLDWLWRSWISLGVAGHGSGARADRVIDPESVVLASSVWARYDARLFDEMLDWLCLHSSLINLQRLRNLHQSGLGDGAILSTMAGVIVHNSAQSKWKVLINVPEQQTPLTPLFLSLTGNTPVWGTPEPQFAQQGFHRGTLELRQMSQPPSPHLAPNVWLKLRSLFGTSTRAEIMLHLLTAGPATAAEIARRTGFTSRAILMPLREMELSGHLYGPPRPERSRPQRGQPTPERTRGLSQAYSLRPDEWSFLRTWDDPTGFPALQSPALLLLLCQKSLSCFSSQASTASMEAIRLRESISPVLADISRQGLSGEYGLSIARPGDRLITDLAEILPKAIAHL